uniref:Putative ovule protein n=1 Tax=Solanum chacoense TaxID=4108 RepID=A0A0V0HDY8_SOLCH
MLPPSILPSKPLLKKICMDNPLSRIYLMFKVTGVSEVDKSFNFQLPRNSNCSCLSFNASSIQISAQNGRPCQLDKIR